METLLGIADWVLVAKYYFGTAACIAVFCALDLWFGNLRYPIFDRFIMLGWAFALGPVIAVGVLFVWLKNKILSFRIKKERKKKI